MLLILNGTVVTRNAKGECIRDGCVAADSGIIAAVGTRKELTERYPDAETLDACGGLIMPSLIDADASPFSPVLPAVLSLEMDPFDPCAAYNDQKARSIRKTDLGALLSFSYAAAVRCVKHGIGTAFMRHSGCPCVLGSLSTIASAFREVGVRLSAGVECCPKFGEAQFGSAIAESVDFASFCGSLNIDTVRCFHAVNAVETPDGMLESFRSAAANGLTELVFSQSVPALAEHFKRYKTIPLGRAEAFGLFDGDTVLTDCSLFGQAELERAAKQGASVVVSAPTDLVKGVSPLDPYEFMQAGADLLIGTGDTKTDVLDSAASYLIFASARHGTTEELIGFVSNALFRSNARFASRCFGIKLGVLEPGAAADIAIMDVPAFDLCERAIDRALLFNAGGLACRSAVIAGKPVMIDRKLPNVNEKKLRVDLEKSVRKLL